MTRRYEVTCCDDCGKPVYRNVGQSGNWDGIIRPYRVFQQVPWSITSANEGESAVVCEACCLKHAAEAVTASV
jgi:hypothetical protein